MSDQAAGLATGASGGLAGAWAALRNAELLLAVGIVLILVVLLLPLPGPLLDAGLAISFLFSFVILMTALFIKEPLELSSFPLILLVSTMLRLALNIASTRLILSQGHQGTDAAGHIIEAFGNLLMQGNFVIGVIVFAILTLVNFIVITKGSGRIAEVSARFSLDAMPGNQMAIDADLSSGLINEDEARRRRLKLEQESNFYGAMDGASKFVRGDAIAGLIITIINVLGGFVIGVVQQGMGAAEAAHTFTLLSIGDGLVSQIPALIVSTGAGIMVSKAGVEGSAEKAIFGQLSVYPQALGMTGALLIVIGFLPGMPTLLFLALGGAAAYAAWSLAKRKKAEAAAANLPLPEPEAQASEPPISQTLTMDYLKVELGYALLPMVNDARGYRLTDQIKALRRQLAADMGFVMPSVRILDNMQLGANAYVIRIKEVEAGRGDLMLGQLLVMDPRGGQPDLAGIPTREPAFGLPAAWIDEALRDEAAFRGYTIVDPATVLTTHLTELLKANMAELLSYAETKKLLDELPAEHRKLVEDVVPAQITISALQRVLQALLAERVSIRDMPTILEAIAEMPGAHHYTLVEHVRTRLARQICHANTAPGGYLPLVSLSPAWEQAFAESLVGDGAMKQLAMAPSRLQEFIAGVRQRFDQAGAGGETPVLLTSPGIRPYVRSIVERFRPFTVVMSQNEIHPSVKLRTLGAV